MSFQHDSTGIDPDEQFPILPEGWYPFRIFDAEELQSKNGNDMVLAKCEVYGDERYPDMHVWHYVTFLPKENKGAGISVHFRKCIGVPFGGLDDVDASDWIGKRFMGKIEHRVYKGKKNHQIVESSPMREDGTSPELAAAMNAQAPIKDAGSALPPAGDNDIPF